MNKLEIVSLAIQTLKRAASSDGFRSSADPMEFFSCSDIDELLEANGEESYRASRKFKSMSMPAKEVAELCESVILKICS